METLKIVWHDPHLYNWENSRYIEEFPFTYELRAFSEVEETIKFLESEENKWVLVTSGRNGEALVSCVNGHKNVIGIIIFCRNKKKHQKWSIMYSKEIEIETRGFSKVLEHATEMFNRGVAHSVLQLGENSGKGMKILMDAVDPSQSSNQHRYSNKYYHMQNELEMSFLMIIKLALKMKKIDRDKVLAEFLSLKPSNEVKNAFKKGKKNLIKSILYLYSTNEVFNELNQCFASNEYHKVAYITAALMLELKAREADFMLQEETVLYRGAELTNEEKNAYVIGRSGFFSAFTSTSKKESVSRNECHRGNIQFEVHLSLKIPHPHIVFPARWSMVNSEKEVLLLPYFPFIVEAITDLTDNHGPYTRIVVRQDENHPSLVLDSEVLLNYWLDKIWNYVSVPFNNLYQQISSKISGYIDFSQYFYNRNPKTEKTQFEDELESVITWVYDWALHNSYITSLGKDASIKNYWKTLKKLIISGMAKHLKEKINKIFELDFMKMNENIKKNLVKIMNGEILATFDISLDLLSDCIKPIFKEAEKYLIQSEPSSSDTESSKYINCFKNTVVTAMKVAMSGERLPIIDRTTNELRIRLNMQLKSLENKISKVIGNMF